VAGEIVNAPGDDPIRLSAAPPERWYYQSAARFARLRHFEIVEEVPDLAGEELGTSGEVLD